MTKTKKQNYIQDVIKALHIASKQDEVERNGGQQFVSTHKVHKNKKKYNRNDAKKDLSKLLDRS